MSIVSKMNSLITSINTVTGESKSDLTNAVQDLIDGYGTGGSVASLIVTAPVGTVIIVSKSPITHTKTATESTTTFLLEELGTWEVQMVSGETTVTKSVIASASIVKYTILPEGYKQLQYIESTGSQYINTNVCNKYTIKLKLDMQFTDIQTRSGFGGTFDNVYGTKSFIAFYADSGFFNFRFSNSTTEVQAATADLLRHTVELENGSQKIDSVEVASQSMASTEDTSVTMALFAAHYSWGSGWSYNDKSSAILYSCQIYDGDTLLRDYVPCKRTSDYSAGLYDTVNDVFYGNEGSGSFVEGPEV